MARLDTYEKRETGMDRYLSQYGFNFSKKMYEWAVSMMRDRNGNKMQTVEKEPLMNMLKTNGVSVENDKGYNIPYVYVMAKADYMGSSISDEAHLARFVKDYCDDPDGSPTRAFDEFYAKTIALGIPIIWEDLL